MLLQSTFIALLAGGVIVFYALILRPAAQKREELADFYAFCDSFWSKLWLRIKHWWLIVAGGVALIIPELPDLLTQFGMFDFAFFLAEDSAKWWARVIGIAAFVLRMILGTPMPKVETTPEAK